MNRVERGRWKLVRSRSTARNRKPGVMKMSVSPLHGLMAPSWRRDTDSSSRSEVVPIDTTRPPRMRVASTARAVAGETSPHSACIVWASVSSTRTGWKVPAPTCSVTPAVVMPLSASAAISSGVKCRPAVGAATEPSCLANSVW